MYHSFGYDGMDAYSMGESSAGLSGSADLLSAPSQGMSLGTFLSIFSGSNFGKAYFCNVKYFPHANYRRNIAFEAFPVVGKVKSAVSSSPEGFH
jgi:hypothetical protein